MDNLEKLSDAELRHRLLQYGFPNMPVTNTTRKILIKKLRNHLTNEKAKLFRERSYVTRYSSDDESDIDNKYKKGRSTGILQNTSKNMESPVPVTNIRKRSPLSKIYVPLPIRSKDRDSNYAFSHTKRSYDSYSPISSTSLSYIDHYMTPDKTNNESLPYRYISPQNSENNGYNGNTTEFTSEFSRRLLNLRNQTIRNSFESKKEQTYLTPETINVLKSKKQINGKIFSLAKLKQYLNQLSDHYGSSIPCVLVSSLLLFLTLVGFVYINITPDLVNTINENKIVYNLCESEQYSYDGSEPIACITKTSLPFVLNLLKKIIPELEQRSKNHFCKDNSKLLSMSENDIIQYIKGQDNTIGINKILSALQEAEYLIDQNPQWKLANIDSNGRILNLNEVADLRNSQKNFFTILNPSLPLSCQLFIKIQKLFTIVGLFTLVSVIVYIIFIVYKWFNDYRQSMSDTLNAFVGDIIDELQQKALNDSEQSFVVVNHLRDKLVPVNARNQKESTWNKAIEYLEQNESRVQFDMLVRNGENCKIMKWIDPIVTEKVGSRSSLKKWHSPAFDKSNKISNPPTECLKIRQMFDKFETNNPNLKEMIQDAILEKVGSTCRIFDIQLDTESCCVYVRCATQKDAGIVHNEINGWWFDKRLVSIKFLRLERYISRFPTSQSGPNCLYPSNTNNLSMSHCDKSHHSLNGIDFDDDELNLMK